MATKRKKRIQDLAILHADAAGIDVGASEIFVAVPADRDVDSVSPLGRAAAIQLSAAGGDLRHSVTLETSG